MLLLHILCVGQRLHVEVLVTLMLHQMMLKPLHDCASLSNNPPIRLGVTGGVIRFLSPRKDHNIVRIFPPNCSPLSITKYYRILHSMTPRSNNMARGVIAVERAVINARASVEYMSIVTIKNWIPTFAFRTGSSIWSGLCEKMQFPLISYLGRASYAWSALSNFFINVVRHMKSVIFLAPRVVRQNLRWMTCKPWVMCQVHVIFPKQSWNKPW